MEKIISIEGMTCVNCVNSIEKKLSSMKGVKKIKVDLIENEANVTFDPKKTSLEKIKSKISELGYSADGMKVVKKSNDLMSGIIYGIVPHIGCIGFLVASIFGVTFFTEFFKPLLMNPYFFYILIALSLGFATLSSSIYLRNNGLLSMAGAKRKWKYLGTMYGSTVLINLLFFLVLFPMFANVSLASPITGASIGLEDLGGSLVLEVNIPCSGHAPLISGELKSIEGVEFVEFSFPNLFDVKYDTEKTTKEEILSLEVFETYKATLVEGGEEVIAQASSNSKSSGGGCGCGGSTCGGGSGSCCGGGY